MTTKYFILTRPSNSRTDNNTDNQIVHLNPGERQVFLLPEVNLDYYWRRGLFESQLIEWTKQFCSKDKIFLDIGAHTGTYAISLAAHSKYVIAFEPQRATYYALCGSVAASGLADKITCHHFGLGAEDQVGIQTLKIVSNDGGGSSLSPAENERVIREEAVEIRTLDSIIGFTAEDSKSEIFRRGSSDENVKNAGHEVVGVRGFAGEISEAQRRESRKSNEVRNDIGFIKMDVENNELNVLRGALNTLRESNYPPILFESNGSNPALFGFLKEALKYKIVNVGGVSNMFLACKE